MSVAVCLYYNITDLLQAVHLSISAANVHSAMPRPVVTDPDLFIHQYMTHDFTIHTNGNNTMMKLEHIPITVLITSCARWDKLVTTIESLETFNTYQNIQRRIVMDDCNDTEGMNRMKKQYHTKYGYEFIHTTTPRNHNFTKTSRRVIYAIYEGITKYCNTSYVFQLEDDWTFYKHGFIEDSLAILKSDALGNNEGRYKNISMLFLRNTQIIKANPIMGIGDFCGGPMRLKYVNNIYDNRYQSYHANLSYWLYQGGARGCWLTWTANPGLTHTQTLIDKIEGCMENQRTTSYGVFDWEHCVCCQFARDGYTMASTTMYDGYVGHAGKETHVNQNIKRRRTAMSWIANTNASWFRKINDQFAINTSNCQYIQMSNYSMSDYNWTYTDWI
eukprot:173495_1